MRLIYSWIGCLLLVGCGVNVLGRSGGPPATESQNRDLVCNEMTPNPTFHSAPQTGNGGYYLDISPPMSEVMNGFNYTAGVTYTISLVGTPAASTIRGFLVQARVPGNGPPAAPMLLGTFVTGAGNQGVLDCDSVGTSMATIAHNQPQGDVNSIQFSWMPPSVDGAVDFHYTVVRMQQMHYDALSAREEGPPPATTTSGVDNTTAGPTTDSMVDTTTAGPTTDSMVTQPPPDNTQAPQKLPNNYTFILKSPDQCMREDCNVFIGIDINTGNSSYLDIYMEGTAEGWVAVGFSETSNMFSSDVVACNRLGNDVTALDTWNLPAGNRGSNTDSIQDVYLFEGSFVDGRISCKIAKRIAASDGFDFDLDRDLFLIYALRLSPSTMLSTLASHAGGMQIRGMSAAEINPAQASGGIGVDEFDLIHKKRLVRAHGILMIIAWPLLATTAIFFATVMRPALPNGEWFQVHRALMLISLFVATAGFILIFVSLKNLNGLLDFTKNINRAHFIIGVIVMAMHIANPIIAAFRCKPDADKRWIFNILHGSLIGTIVETLALVNAGLGLAIFSENFSRVPVPFAPLWLYVAWAVFNAVVIIGFLILFGVYYCFSEKKCYGKSSCGKSKGAINDGLEMKPTDEKEIPSSAEDEIPPKKIPSKDSPFRWFTLVVYLVITIPALVAVIVMVALPA